MKMMTVMLIAVLSVSLFLVGMTSSAPYDPWIDLDDDGDIDIFDIVQMAGAYGTTGTPINKTALLLDLEARIDLLNVTVMALQGGYVAETGEFDGVVNTDMVEKVGVTTINFNTPFTSVEKPGMVISVVLKHAANGLPEGSAIRVVEDVKGTSGNWYGFDLTVSKYSDGTSIDDLTQVYVTWIAIGTAESQPAKRVVAGQVTGLPPNLNDIAMPVSLPGANSSNTIVVASGFKVEDSVTTPLAVRGIVQSESTISFQVWDIDGNAYAPAAWEAIEISYTVIDR